MSKRPDNPPRIIVSVDVVLLTLHGGRLQVLLMRRDREPFAGQLALPGGYIRPDVDDDALSAARRVLADKTGVDSPYLEQLCTFASGARDPRGWSVSIAFYALVSEASLRRTGREAFELLEADALPRLSFDHDRIVETALDRVRNKSAYSSLPCYLLPEQFTLTKLQQTYEQVMGVRLEKSAFRRKLSDLGFVQPVPGAQQTGQHRPAQLYCLKPGARLAVFDRSF